jgi:hypothetical protein
MRARLKSPPRRQAGLRRDLRRTVACATAAAVLLAGGVALACGGAFGGNITVDSHQDIIIAWKNGVETYVFQPTFCGTSTAFGLILPVPASLSSEPSIADQSAFNAAVTLSEPSKREVEEPTGGIGCGGNDNAAGGRASDDEPAVVAGGRVGFLDWVQLKADNTSAFTSWLDSNGYPYSATASSTFAYYVSRGWYFLAFRISQNVAAGSETICQALGPIAVSFPADGPVVPSRMAAASSSGGISYSSNLRWRVFGITSSDSQLSLPNATDQYSGLWYSGTIQATDAPQFAGLAEAGDRLTRLLLSFNTGSATADAPLVLAAAQDYRGTEDVVVQDSSCSVRPHGRRAHCLLSLLGLSVVGLCCWRRWR